MPKEIIKILNLSSKDELELSVHDNELILKKINH
ncbi:MAG: AbrB/MazE/SpoVT family DNA-binding domain-containing protein [Mycoplasmatales bacterium]